MMDSNHGRLPLGENPPPLPSNPDNGYSTYYTVPYNVTVTTTQCHVDAAHQQGYSQIMPQPPPLPEAVSHEYQQHNYYHHQQPHTMYHIPTKEHSLQLFPADNVVSLNYHHHQYNPSPPQDEGGMKEPFISQQQQHDEKEELLLNRIEIEPVPVNVQHHHFDHYHRSETQQQPILESPIESYISITTHDANNDMTSILNNDSNAFQSVDLINMDTSSAALAAATAENEAHPLQPTHESLKVTEKSTAEIKHSSISLFPFNDILTQLLWARERATTKKMIGERRFLISPL